ncbi:MAG: hypothetical protein IJV35_04195 [Neisseriaceae bacterium]|nr:hypothetical protein [Neisseriaceae bacterium]
MNKADILPPFCCLVSKIFSGSLKEIRKRGVTTPLALINRLAIYWIATILLAAKSRNDTQ